MPEEIEVVCPGCWGEFSVELEADEEIECEECGTDFYLEDSD